MGDERDRAREAATHLPNAGEDLLPRHGTPSSELAAPDQPVASGLVQGPRLGAPNRDGNNVPYEIPATDYRAHLRSELPPLGSEMPMASIADPGPIPNWKTSAPARTTKVGAFEYTEPASDYIVHGALHSQTALQAWESHGAFLQKVQSTWNDDARAKINTYAQQKNGDANLQKLVDETKTDFNVGSIKQGGGTIGEQAQNQNITPGNTTKTVAAAVKTGGKDLLTGAEASAAHPENSTVASAVKGRVDELNLARSHTQASVDKLAGTSIQVDAANKHVSAAKTKVEELAKKEADAEDKTVASAKELAKKVGPTLGNLLVTLAQLKEPLGKLKGAATGLAAGSPAAALDGVMALIAIAKWSALQRQAEELKILAGPTSDMQEVVAAAEMVIGIAQTARGFSTELEANIKLEKIAYERLATTLEMPGNWKGKNGDAQQAANALRAIPICDRVLRVLREVRGALPKPPSASTRAAQGHTLATQGLNAPGADELYTVASWIASASEAVSAEISTWEAMRAQLALVSGALGVK